MKKFIFLCLITFMSLSLYSQEQEVDKTAKFAGKPKNIVDFIIQNQEYPDDAWWNLTEGTVVVEGIVAKDGSFIELKIKNSVEPLLDLEALRIAELMQSWKPAKKSKEAVNSFVLVEIPFFISAQEKEQIEIYKRYGLENKMPLFVLDNKIVKGKDHLYTYNLKSIRVLKGTKAIEKYGQDAKNGVIEITSKMGTPPL